jgi:hypothetical protein
MQSMPKEEVLFDLADFFKIPLLIFYEITKLFLLIPKHNVYPPSKRHHLEPFLLDQTDFWRELIERASSKLPQLLHLFCVVYSLLVIDKPLDVDREGDNIVDS